MLGIGWLGGLAAGWLLLALLWAGFLAVVVWAVTRLFPRSRPRPGGGEEPRGVPGRRSAAGEIGEGAGEIGEGAGETDGGAGEFDEGAGGGGAGEIDGGAGEIDGSADEGAGETDGGAGEFGEDACWPLRGERTLTH